MYDDYEFDGQESGASTIIGVFILCALILGGAVGLIWYLQGPFVGGKFIEALVSPLGILWSMLFAGAMVATFTKQKFLAVLLWVMMLGLSMLGNASVANNLISGLEEPQRKNIELDAEQVFDYGFVLGGGMELNRFQTLDFNAAGERVSSAIKLYKQGKIKHLVFAGSPFLFDDDERKARAAEDLPGPEVSKPVANEESQDSDSAEPDESLIEDLDTGEPSSGPAAQVESDDAAAATANPAATNQSSYETAMREMLSQMGVAESDFSFIGGRTTAEEVLRIDEFLQDKPNTENAMITSAWHMKRAAQLRLAQGLSMKSIPVDFRSTGIVDDPAFFVPNISAFETSSVAIKEYLAGWLQ